MEFVSFRTFGGEPDVNEFYIKEWQNYGSPPPPGGSGPLCEVCGQSTWVELGGGDGKDVYHPNIDIRPLSGVDVVHDLSLGIPFHDGHAAKIKSIHLINHLSYMAAKKLFLESYRVLRSSGSLFIMVTDLGFLAERILVDGLQPAWMTGIYGTQGDTYDDDYHYWGYTTQSLQRELERVGFADVHQHGYYNRWEFKMSGVKP